MKKNILIFLSLAILAACSSRKSSENKTVGLKGFSAYYNTLFNSKDALETELKDRDKNHQDNFYAPYIRILTTEDEPLGADAFSQDEKPVAVGFGQVPSGPQQKGATTLEIAAAKAEKAIKKYSVLKDGEEKNKMMFDAHILLAQSKLYQNKPLEALDALNYLFSNMRKDKRLDLARIYQAQSYTKLKDYYRANEIFLSLKNLPKSYDALKTVYYSQMLVEAGKKDEAATELENAFKANGKRELRSRIAFLRGQVLAASGKNEEARESFTTAYKLANDFEFEVKSQVEIAKTFNGKSDDYEGAKKYIENISKKGTYASRRNEFYYALGLMAQKAGKTEEAQAFFHKALAEKMSDPQLRGLTFYEIGKNYFDENDYIAAGAYYDSAAAVMTHEPTKIRLADLSSNIKKIRDNYYLVKKNDSILALTKMSDTERRAYFGKFIDEMKAKEAVKIAEQKRADREKGFDTGDYNANAATRTGFQDFAAPKGGFYFANQNTVAKGESDFRQIWGDRAAQDNWRFSSRSASIEDLKNESMGIVSAKNPRRFEPDFYIEQIPTDTQKISELKKDRDTASLGLGRMYENYFSNTALATKTLYDLVDNNPEAEVKLQALYQIFSMNYEKNPTAAERAKNMIISEFPYTSYAEFAKNPRNTTFTKSSSEVENAYRQAYNLYSEGKFEDSRTLIEASLAKYPKDALVPKFTLLNAYNAGKTAGKEIMILQLQQLALNYKNTPEGTKAQDILNYLKSDLVGQDFATQNHPDNQRAQQPAAEAIRSGISPNAPVSGSTISAQTVDAPVPQMNTTQNVVLPAQNKPMPTSPSVAPGKVPAPRRLPNTPPGFNTPSTGGVGVPEMSAEELKKINTAGTSAPK